MNLTRIFYNPVFIAVLILSAWLYVFQSGIITAIAIWTISDIFVHCFLVVPLSVYFIYKKRSQLMNIPFKPNYWLLVILAGCLFVQLFGFVGDIQLFMHIATFTSLPLLIWMFIGNSAAKVILFPLTMMLFAIPVGEQLIPFLQDLTTDMAVPLLELTGVPIYRNGLYLDIPEGRFLVAEACSGISFLIASIVFGCVYSYISFHQFNKQVIFVLVSIIVPIVANALRVYGIVLTGHLSNMEHAVGADHLIYGGVFYGIIIFILITIGEKFRDLPINDKNKDNEINATRTALPQTFNFKLISVVLVMFLGQHLWLQSLTKPHQDKIIDIAINSKLLTLEPHTSLSPWLPNFKSAKAVESGVFTYKNREVDLFIAGYHSYDLSGELISSLNNLYSHDRWALINQYTQYFDKINHTVVITHITSPQGHERIIAHWYEIAGRPFTSKVKAKLYETGLKIFGIESVNKFVSFSIKKPEKMSNVDKTLNDIFLHYQLSLAKVKPVNE